MAGFTEAVVAGGLILQFLPPLCPLALRLPVAVAVVLKSSKQSASSDAVSSLEEVGTGGGGGGGGVMLSWVLRMQWQWRKIENEVSCTKGTKTKGKVGRRAGTQVNE